jgi:hypothetical protein
LGTSSAKRLRLCSKYRRYETGPSPGAGNAKHRSGRMAQGPLCASRMIAAASHRRPPYNRPRTDRDNNIHSRIADGYQQRGFSAPGRSDIGYCFASRFHQPVGCTNEKFQRYFVDYRSLTVAAEPAQRERDRPLQANGLARSTPTRPLDPVRTTTPKPVALSGTIALHGPLPRVAVGSTLASVDPLSQLTRTDIALLSMVVE